MTQSLTTRLPLAMLIALAALAAPLLPAPAAAESRWSSNQRESYVLFTGGSQSVAMSGSTDDLRRARALRTGGESLLYVRHGGAAYVIRDPVVLRWAKAIFEPQELLGSQQAALGRRQAALGRRQAELGAQQARIGLQQARSAPVQQEALARRQDALGRQQDALGQQQDALGRQQDALGRQQDRLGREAESKLRALVADAVRRGLAQRVE